MSESALPTQSQQARPLLPAPTRSWQWLFAALVFVSSFIFRLLIGPDFSNDDFMHLALAQQILLGELPIRDFASLGALLHSCASTLALASLGHTLLGETLLTLFFLSVSATCLFLLATRASGSPLIGLVTTVMSIALPLRYYNYPKVFVYAVAIWLLWRYVDQRSLGRLLLVAVWTVIAFFFRFDHGAYMGLATGVMLFATHWPDGSLQLLRRAALYGCVVIILLLPYFGVLALHGSLFTQLESSLSWSRWEVKRTWLQWPAFEINWPAPLFRMEKPPPPQVNIRWAADISAMKRAEKEQLYQLTQPEFREGQTWSYALTDATEVNVAALVHDRTIEDTHGVDRATYQVKMPPQEGSKIHIAPGFFHATNALPWLYYTFISLPPLVILLLLFRHIRSKPGQRFFALELPKILTVATLCFLIDHGFLRVPLEPRIADVSVPTAVLGAWLLGRGLALPAWSQLWTGRRSGLPWHLPRPDVGFSRSLLSTALRSFVVIGLVWITWLSIKLVGHWEQNLQRSALLSGFPAMASRATQVVHALGSPPLESSYQPGMAQFTALTHYLQSCTTPDDRLLVTWYAPELFFYTERGFAGGRVYFLEGLPVDQQLILARLQTQSVPIALVNVAEYQRWFIRDFPLLHAYLETHYRLAGELELKATRYQVLADRNAVPSGIYEPLGLACFQGNEQENK